MVVNFMFNPAAAPALAGAKRNLQLHVQAQRSLNTDARNASASLALRIYVDCSVIEAFANGRACQTLYSRLLSHGSRVGIVISPRKSR